MSSVMFQTDTAIEGFLFIKRMIFHILRLEFFQTAGLAHDFGAKILVPFSLFLVEIGLQMMFGYGLDRYESLSSWTIF